MVILAPTEVDEIMRRTPEGKLIIYEALAELRHGTTIWSIMITEFSTNSVDIWQKLKKKVLFLTDER